MKKLFLVTIIIVFVFFAFYFSKDYLISTFVNKTMSRFLGARVELSGYSWEILNSAINIKDCKIYNPKGFPEGLLVDIQDMRCEYDLTLLLKKELHLTLFELTLKELLVIKEESGKFNLDALNFIQKQKAVGENHKTPVEQKPMHIDVLKFSVDKVIYKDFSQGDKPLIKAQHVNIKKTYNNITSAEQLGLLLFSESVKSLTITGLKVYGLAALTGVYFLPVGAVAILTDKDGVVADFDIGLEQAYKISLKVVDELGDIVKQDISTGVIKGKVHGVDVVIKILQKKNAALSISVSARNFFFPKPAIAEGVLYEITQKISAR